MSVLQGDAAASGTWRDFCPLCGRRFAAPGPDELAQQILDHLNDGSCEKNWRPIDIVLHDDGSDLARGGDAQYGEQPSDSR